MCNSFVILAKLAEECKLTDTARIHDEVMKRYDKIVNEHINNVFPIKEPGEKGGDPCKWLTKMTPHNRNHDGKIRANSRKELEDKIVAYYLDIQANDNVTIRRLLVDALGGDETSLGATAKRTLQRFDKHLSSLGKIKVSQLQESDIRAALDKMLAERLKQKEFNETITCLNKIADYCAYEHIAILPIREIIQAYRNYKLKGKHIFIPVSKETIDLAFSKAEANMVVRYALMNPSYKSLSVAILVTTGLRVGELLALELRDIHINDNKGYLYIHQMEDTKTREIHDYAKCNKCRQVVLDSDALAIVKKTIEFREYDENESPFLILNSNSDDGKMHLRAIDDFMRTTIHNEVLGYDSEREARSPHDCRRTYATLEYLNGANIKRISKQLGHSKVSQTYEYIIDIAEFEERQSLLPGIGLDLGDLVANTPPMGLDACCTQ